MDNLKMVCQKLRNGLRININSFFKNPACGKRKIKFPR